MAQARPSIKPLVGDAMTSPDDQRRRQVADIVMYWMRRRGLTRQVFADRLGRSVSWVDKIRNGDRQLDRLSVLRQIAQVLDIPLSVLIDPEEAERRRLCPDNREIDAIRSALRLSWTYQLTASTAMKLGDPQLLWVAADRGIQLAEQTEDLTLVGSAARQVANALILTRQGPDAVVLVRTAADRLAPRLTDADPAFVSAYGMLLLKGSIAAARMHQAADVRDLQAEALTAAQLLGSDHRNELWTAFGATNVLVHQASALAEMQSGGRIIEAAARISQADLTRALITEIVRSYPRGRSAPTPLAGLARATGVAV